MLTLENLAKLDLQAALSFPEPELNLHLATYVTRYPERNQYTGVGKVIKGQPIWLNHVNNPSTCPSYSRGWDGIFELLVCLPALHLDFTFELSSGKVGIRAIGDMCSLCIVEFLPENSNARRVTKQVAMVILVAMARHHSGYVGNWRTITLH